VLYCSLLRMSNLEVGDRNNRSGSKVYYGMMIVGQHTRDNDLEVSVLNCASIFAPIPRGGPDLADPEDAREGGGVYRD
jgi:hypothetical protein